MRKTLALLSTLVCCLSIHARAQTAQVTGTVRDTINQTIPANTVILLLRPADTTMVAYTRADTKGHFAFDNVPPGGYLLWISHPAFAQYSDSIGVKPGANNLGAIYLTLRSKLLADITIKGVNPIRIKGDTTEFTADSFAVRPGATVEDLLKVLPGIQVDKDGKITAMGQTAKILVDGEEFFGDDPTVATRNISASAVDKVQVFDKKSDQAAFTGIDDGQTQKTINLKLKNDRKNGYFGKLTGGLGTNGYYENTAALNLFQKKRKFAVFGIAANTGKTGLNMADAGNYSTNGLTTMAGDGGVMMFFGGGNNDFTDWNGSYSGQGVPVAWNAGAHYSNKYNDDKITIGGDYIFNQVSVGVNNNTISRLTLPDSTINNTVDNNYKKITDIQHSLNLRYDVQLDSLDEVKVTAVGKVRHKDTFLRDTSYTSNQDSALLNNSGNHQNYTGQNNTFNSTLLWMHKTHKIGRTLSFSAQEDYNEVNTTGYQYSVVNGYEGGVLQSQDTTDQYKSDYSRSLSLITKLTYTEPLGHSNYLTFDYGVNLLSSSSDKNSYNRDGGGKYVMLDSAYSNYYTLNILANTGGVFFKRSTKKYNFSFGTDAGYTSYNQDNIYQDTVRKRSFVNWYPKASFSTKFGNGGRFGIQYYGNTTQPSLDQLQPVANNNNPLNIVMGNPNLKPSYTSQIYLNAGRYDVLKDRGYNVWGNFTMVNNAFGSKDSIDAVGKSYSETVNVNSSENAYLSGNYDFKWKKPDIRLGFGPSLNYSKNTNYVNGQLNNTHSGSAGLGASIGKSKDKKYDFWVNARANYNVSQSSIQSANNLAYWTYSVNGNASKQLPAKFMLTADCDMSFYQKIGNFNQRNIALVNASIQKMFFKNNDLVLKAAINDIFNQNTGFSRNISTNLATQSMYTAIHRYLLFSVTWNFSKNGKPAENPF
ncbi:MAG TPA: outer membrane beta-barrel protein [Dinghuibacter sp.]|jgi:hypothetical protein|uniref:outer membrane beta-barrel protein n=1 Tax=Dinghuibacter sp. TaxID=2024697 RepID=UPI002CDD68D6|nr:outer membrane beta-barrel protein [Dinghuibacter sp.]HTJ13804.1 outer membrane beta-barrel protein [Dinghuibacter sp.]